MSCSVTVAAGAGSFFLLLAGRGSQPDTSAASTPSFAEVATSSTIVPSACPSAASAGSAAPEWTLAGTTGTITVTGSTDTSAPSVKVEAPFSVTETQVHTLTAGGGPVVGNAATVSVC
jgi:hypothetical protein